MKNFLGGIKKAELKIIVAGESGNPEDWINEHKLGYVTINFEKYE